MSSEVSLSWSLSLFLFLLASSLHKEGKMMAECPKLTLSQFSYLSKKRTYFQLPVSVLGKTLIGLAWVRCPYTSQSCGQGNRVPKSTCLDYVPTLARNVHGGLSYQNLMKIGAGISQGNLKMGMGKHSIRHYSTPLHCVSQVSLKKKGGICYKDARQASSWASGENLKPSGRRQLLTAEMLHSSLSETPLSLLLSLPCGKKVVSLHPPSF